MSTEPTETIVDRLYVEFRALNDLLARESEPSLAITANDCFRKVLLLSAASHFEQAIANSIEEFVASTAGGNEQVIAFVKNQALTRQYHALFDWKVRNANKFFSLFGDSFKRAMEARLKLDSSLSESIAAFLELGRDRNRMVHEDFGQFVLEKTSDEIYQLFKKAASFVEALPNLLSTGASLGGDAS